MEDNGLNLIVCEPARLIFVLAPKCGSSGTVNLFLRLSGLTFAEGEDRVFARRAMKDGSLQKAGLQFYRCGQEQVRRMQDRHPDFALFANIRDPYARALSNYYSKINRYARAFEPAVFRYGKWRQFLDGPRKWGPSRHGNTYMRDRISFDDMLKGLARHGIDFDPHFDLQCRLLDISHLAYARLFRLETLDRDLLPGLAAHGLPDHMLERAQHLVRVNSSDYRRDRDMALTPSARAAIAQLYAQDFSVLGYPVDPDGATPLV